MDDSVHPELKGLKGGLKQMWLRTHRAEVEQYYHENGPDATLKRFNLGEDTLKRFFERRGNDIRLSKLSENDRMVLRIAMEGDRALNRRVTALEEKMAEIEPIIQIGKGMIATFVGPHVQSQKIKPPEKKLLLSDFRKKSGKRN